MGFVGERVRLGDVCEVVSGSTPKTSVEEYWDGDIDWITPAELNDNSYILKESVRKITDLGVEKTGLKPFPKGTVILSSRAPIGKVAIAGKEMYCNQGFKNLICSERIDSKYLFWFLKGKTDYLNSLGRGATFKEISKGIVESIEISIPDLQTQKTVVYRFEAIQSLITLRRRQSEQLDTLIKARFVEMFGDPMENPKGFPVKRIDEVSELIKGITYSPDDVYSEGMIVLRSSNIKGNQFDLEDLVKITKSIPEDKWVRKNDILMCNRNGSARLVGKVALIPSLTENMTFGTFMTIVRSDIYDYLYVFFQMKAFREQIKFQTAVAINQISLPLLASVKVPLPPIEKIEEFSRFKEQVDKSKLLN